MCGKETAGYHAADAGLFQGQTFILSRNARTDHQIEEISLALINQIGAKPLFLSANEHDQLVAVSSHLPYLISAALMNRAAQMKDERIWPVSASGFRDTTRVASGSADMWVDIIDTNRAALETELERYHEELQGLIKILRSGNGDDIRKWLEEAAADRNKILQLNRFLKR